jgi:MFS family permease
MSNHNINLTTSNTQSYIPILLFIASALMSALLNSTAPTPLYPVYQQQLGLTSVNLTIIYGAYAGGVLISLLAVGSLSQRITDQRYMMLPALMIVFFGALIFIYANSFEMLFLARLFSGIGTGALTGAANVSLVKYGPKDQGKTAALIATLSFTTGLALGPVISGVALQTGYHPTTLPYNFIMIVTVISIFGVYFSWPASGQNIVKGLSKDESNEHSTLSSGLSITGTRFTLCAMALFTCWAVAASLFSIGPVVTEKLLHIKQHGVFGYIIAVYLIVAGISQILCRKNDPVQSLVIGFIAQMLSLLIFYVSIHTGSFFWGCGGMLVAGYAYGAIFVGSATLVNLISPKGCHAKLVSLFYIIAYLANWVPVLLGIIVDHQSLRLAVDLLLTISGIILLILAYGIRNTKFI